jgi:hypothetical protein
MLQVSVRNGPCCILLPLQRPACLARKTQDVIKGQVGLSTLHALALCSGVVNQKPPNADCCGSIAFSKDTHTCCRCVLIGLALSLGLALHILWGLDLLDSPAGH